MITIEDLKRLLEQKPPCISIYLPIFRGDRQDVRQNPIRLKNALRQAQEKLVAQGMRAAEARDLVTPAERVLAQTPFWEQQAVGLALFLAPDFFEVLKTPLDRTELIYVNNNFFLKPLLSLLGTEQRFYILALHLKHELRLLRCQGATCTRLPLEKVTLPSMQAYLEHYSFEKINQFHTQTAPTQPAARRSAMFHGHGNSLEDQNKTYAREYFKLVDNGVRRLLGDERAPLVLAGVEYVRAIYRDNNFYQNLLPEGIEGNPELWKDEELRLRAAELVQPYFETKRRRELQIYAQARGTGYATERIEEVLPAAHQGRVGSLFVAVNEIKWGSFDPDTTEVKLHSAPENGDTDLLETAAVETLTHGGTVYALPREQMPGQEPVAATYRF